MTTVETTPRAGDDVGASPHVPVPLAPAATTALSGTTIPTSTTPTGAPALPSPRTAPAETDRTSAAAPAQAPAEATGTGAQDPGQAPASPPARGGGPNAATVVVAVAGSLLALIDTTVVNVSLNATSARFGALDRVQWVVTAYLLALAATMPTTAWLTGRFGAKRVFAGSTALFAAGSALCALSPTLVALIGGRVVAGAAAGVLTPAATILLTRGVPREQLGRVQALNGSVMLIGPLLGPTVGGLLIQNFGWPAIYWVNVPFCALMLAVTARGVAPDPAEARARRRLDVVGLVTGSATTVSAVLAIKAFASGASLLSVDVLIPLGVSVLCGVGFVVRELRARTPLLDLRLYAHPVYSWASLNVFFLGFILYGPMVIIPLYFQAARGESPVTTGLLLSTAGVGVVISGLTSRKIMKRFSGGMIMMCGISMTVAATVPLTMLRADTSYLLLCASLVVRGAGIGLTVVPAMTRAFESIPARSIPDASPQLNLLQRIGGAAATALISVILHRQAVAHHGLVPATFARTCVWVLVTTAITLLPAFALALAERRARARRRQDGPDGVPREQAGAQEQSSAQDQPRAQEPAR